MMFEQSYLPRKFCREFAGLRGHSAQLTLIMATVKGLKPVMDDWIRADLYEPYKKICRRYGLFIKPDSIFNCLEAREMPPGVIGGNRLTTTKARGSIFYPSKTKTGSIHLFISRSKNDLEKGYRDGWYPLIIKNRVISKPLVDLYKFGYDLGYPGCCVDFFRKYNNWNRYSHLYEVFKNTPVKSYRYLCNPLLKDDTYSYIYHIPCSYRCSETIRKAGEIRRAIKKEEPGFVRKIDEHLKMPNLVFYERKSYAFSGKIKNGRLDYHAVYYVGQLAENNLYEKILKEGDSLFVEGSEIVILKKGKKIHIINRLRKNFGPEIPFLIQFS